MDKPMDDPVKESLKQIDPNTWLIGPLLLHRSKGHCSTSTSTSTSTWYDQANDDNYTITHAPTPPPPTLPSSSDPKINLVRECGGTSAEATHSAKSNYASAPIASTTPEAATLAFVHAQRPPPDFDIPKVLHHAEHNGRSYLFLSRVPGRTLEEAWSSLDEKWRQHYMNAIVSVCKFLCRRENNMLCGVDGNNVFEPFFIKQNAEEDFSPANLMRSCKEMGMDCEKFVFFHADLAPGNIIVEDIPETGVVGIIDWEVAGYFPRGWIRTKFRVNSGLDLPDGVAESPWEWRSGVAKLLEVNGFEDYSSHWVEMFFFSGGLISRSGPGRDSNAGPRP
ncbi:hypothetical protein N7535_005878 [Penicillium sp. DV-2018c]|nr:hypothetical protein N7461_009457 [Penicillium sp. DV-2018c]KAJ5572218.1 hypothetical protein N7535_005878 [Penicillium sp. DV-2018c]